MTTPLVAIMFKLQMKNKQYGITNPLNFPHVFRSKFLDFKTIQVQFTR